MAALYDVTHYTAPFDLEKESAHLLRNLIVVSTKFLFLRRDIVLSPSHMFVRGLVLFGLICLICV